MALLLVPTVNHLRSFYIVLSRNGLEKKKRKEGWQEMPEQGK